MEAANTLGDIDSEHYERDNHRVASNLYDEVSRNEKLDFTITINNYVSRLNTLALRKPYENQDILLLIEALNDCTNDLHYYHDLKTFYPDIKYIFITDYYRHDYQISNQNVIHEPEPDEATLKQDEYDFDVESNDFDFIDDAVSTSNTISEKVIRKPNVIDEEAAEKHAAAQAAAALIETTILDSEKKRFDSVDQRELRPCVKAFFWIAGLSLIAAMIISWMK